MLEHSQELFPIATFPLTSPVQPFLREFDGLTVKGPYRTRVTPDVIIIVVTHQLPFQKHEEQFLWQMSCRFEPGLHPAESTLLFLRSRSAHHPRGSAPILKPIEFETEKGERPPIPSARMKPAEP